MRIELHDLFERFGSRNVVLNNMDYSDESQAPVTIGPPDGERSTLLRTIGGLIEPTFGTLSINGIPLLSGEEELLKYRGRIGFVLQQNDLSRHTMAMENTTVSSAQVHDYIKSDAEARTSELLERFGLLKDAGKRPSTLSGGQQQRVSIARVVVAKSEFFLLDEPASALDPEHITEVLDTVNELKEEGMDFIIVIHKMGSARHACGKVVFLNGGELPEYGESARPFAEPKTEEFNKSLGRPLGWDV